MTTEEDPSGPLSDTTREKYARLRAEGLKQVEARKKCGISKNTAGRWEKRPEVRARIDFLVEQSAQDQRGESKKEHRQITFNRDDIIMELWDIGSRGESERARVAALMGLADIFLLRAKSINDLRKGVGWTDEETGEFERTGITPDRIYLLTGNRTAADLARATKGRTKKAEKQRE